MKRLIRLLHLLLEFVFHLAVKLYFPFSFGKTYNLDYLSSSVRFLLKSFFYSIVKDHVPPRLVRFPLTIHRVMSVGFCSLSRVLAWSHCDLVGLDGLEPSTSRLSGARSSHLSYKPELTHRLYDSFIFCLSPSPFLPARLLTVGLQDGVPGFGSRHCRLVEMKGIEPLTPCLQGRCSPS